MRHLPRAARALARERACSGLCEFRPAYRCPLQAARCLSATKHFPRRGGILPPAAPAFPGPTASSPRSGLFRSPNLEKVLFWNTEFGECAFLAEKVGKCAFLISQNTLFDLRKLEKPQLRRVNKKAHFPTPRLANPPVMAGCGRAFPCPATSRVRGGAPRGSRRPRGRDRAQRRWRFGCSGAAARRRTPRTSRRRAR